MMLTEKYKIYWILLLVLLIWNISACSNHQQQKNENLFVAAKDSIPYPKIIYLLPSPSEVIQISIDHNITFRTNLDAPKNIEKDAILSQQQALILGVYLTDLSFNIIFKNHQASISNLNSIQVLSQNLGIGPLLTDRYFNRIEKNINNVDSMDVIFDDFVQNAFNTLGTTGNDELLSLISMGAGIEAMYFSFESVDYKTISKSILPILLDQKTIYENYYKNFLMYNHDKIELRKFIGDINTIYSLYRRNTTVNNPEIINKQGNQFAIKDKMSNQINGEGLIKLADSIEIVRNKLVELKYQ